ncbi:MAG: transglycosylase SLT domain-containing protein [Acidobacteria bacterium]|nr:transglycosylase SLT domain-containing protein [Acidobacteriota bacterium]
MSGLDLARALAAALVHFVWQGAAIAALAGAGLVLAAPRGPRARHAVLLAALLAMAAAFAATLGRGLVAPPAAVSALAGQALPPARGPVPAAGGGGWAALPGMPAGSPSATGALLVAWGAGALLMVLRLAGGTARVFWFSRGGAGPLPEPWPARVARLAGGLGVRAAVRVRATARVGVPILAGFARPVILVPAAALSGLPAAALEALIAHELAHLARRDHLVNLLLAALETLLFYHPAVWWISRRLRAEREFCCDELVVTHVTDRVAYARALLEMETLRPAPVALAATGGPLMSRIRHLLAAPREPRRGAGALAVVGLAVFATATILLGASLPAGALSPAALAGTPAAPLGREAGLDIEWLPRALAPWLPEVRNAAATHGVDPRLVALVLMVESAGDPAARSPMGARGLMQVLPATGAFIARERGLGEFDPNRLDDPSTSIDFGAWLLARGLREFGSGRDPSEAVELAAAAYNGGTRAVSAWLTGDGALSEETAAYKDLVRSLWRDRAAPRSPAFEAWLERGGRRLLGTPDTAVSPPR